MNKAEQTIGYDARVAGNDGSQDWPEERRESFLYRLDVRKVFSVDTAVWPSLFSGLPQPLPGQLESLAPGDLWAKQRALRKAVRLRASIGPLPPFQTIMVTLVAEGAQTLHPANTPWQFAGYDVADAYLLSALTNCGFLPGHDNPESLRREWAPHLNEFHLFSQLSAASAFRRFSDVRLANDHAPTFVYGIYTAPH